MHGRSKKPTGTTNFAEELLTLLAHGGTRPTACDKYQTPPHGKAKVVTRGGRLMWQHHDRRWRAVLTNNLDHNWAKARSVALGEGAWRVPRDLKGPAGQTSRHLPARPDAQGQASAGSALPAASGHRPGHHQEVL